MVSFGRELWTSPRARCSTDVAAGTHPGNWIPCGSFRPLCFLHCFCLKDSDGFWKVVLFVQKQRRNLLWWTLGVMCNWWVTKRYVRNEWCAICRLIEFKFKKKTHKQANKKQRWESNSTPARLASSPSSRRWILLIFKNSQDSCLLIRTTLLKRRQMF